MTRGVHASLLVLQVAVGGCARTISMLYWSLGGGGCASLCSYAVCKRERQCSLCWATPIVFFERALLLFTEGFPFHINFLRSAGWAEVLMTVACCVASSCCLCFRAASECLISVLSVFVSLCLHYCIHCIMMYGCASLWV